MAFGLVNNLYVGAFGGGNNKEDGYDISGLHFDYEISRSIVWYENYAKFTLYNASVETVNRILFDGAGILFETGFEDETNGVGTVFVGNITRAYCERNGNDVLTHITATSTRGPNYQLAKVPIAFSFQAGTNFLEVARTISEWTAMPLMGGESLEGIDLDEDFNFSGSVSAALRKVNEMLMDSAVRIYFDNSTLAVIDESEGAGQYQSLSMVKLDYTSGLLSASPVRERDDVLLKKDVEGNLAFYYFGGSTEISGNKVDIEYKPIAEASDRRLKVKFRSLVNPGLVPNTKVFIDNTQSGLPLPAVNGEFLIRKVKFKGNNYGGRCETEGEAAE